MSIFIPPLVCHAEDVSRSRVDHVTDLCFLKCTPGFVTHFCKTLIRDIKIGEAEPRRVIFEMFDSAAPKTVENFLTLCAGTGGMCKSAPTKPLSYKGSGFHRIIPQFMCQGGDFTNGNGTGGESIYGEKFADEAGGLALPHDVKYLLSMANAGPNTNGSQFFITTVPTPHLNGKHAVFGQVGVCLLLFRSRILFFHELSLLQFLLSFGLS